MLSTLNKCDKDACIRFEAATHTYYVDWRGDGKKYEANDTSVTGLVGSQFPAFDADKVLKQIRRKSIRGKRKYGKKSNAQIKAEWKENGRQACEAGTALHEAIENFYKTGRTDHKSKEFANFLEYHEYVTERKKYSPYRSEWMVISDSSSKLVGTIDMCYAKVLEDDPDTLHLIIVDWKRIKALKTFSTRMGLGCCSQLRDANFFKYSLQLNLYRFVLEHFYQDGQVVYRGKRYAKVVVDSLWLVVLHPRLDSYAQFACADLTDIATSLIHTREDQLDSLKRQKCK